MKKKGNKYIWNGVSYKDRSSWEQAKWTDPVYRKKLLKSRRKYWDSPKCKKHIKAMVKATHNSVARIKRSNSLKKHWKKNYNSRVKAARENVKFAIKAIRKNWKDPKFYKKMCIVRKKQGNKLQNRIKNSNGLKKFWSNNANRTRQLLAQRNGQWGDKSKRTYINSKKTIVMRSSWEVKFAYALDTLKIKWQYETKYLKAGNGRRYIPDFYLPKLKTFVEIKGRKAKGFTNRWKNIKRIQSKFKFILLRQKKLKQCGVIDCKRLKRKKLKELLNG